MASMHILFLTISYSHPLRYVYLHGNRTEHGVGGASLDLRASVLGG